MSKKELQKVQYKHTVMGHAVIKRNQVNLSPDIGGYLLYAVK